MKVFGQLERAQAENLGSDPSAGVKGRFYFNTVGGNLKFDDGTNIQTLLYSGAASIVNADVSVTAAIARSKIAAGTADHVVINAASTGVLSSEATLSKSRGGAGADMSSVTFPSSGIISVLGQSMRNIGDYENIGITLASGVLTICQSSTSAFSASAPGYVTLPHSTSGRSITLKVTANVTFNDDSFAGTSDLAGIKFGTATTTAWVPECPFYLYACNTDDTDAGLYFFISRYPSISRAGSSNLAYKTVTATSDDNATQFFITSTNIKVTAVNKPAVLVGCFRMTKSSSDDWTVAPFDYRDMNLQAFDSSFWGFPTGHNGAAASNHFKPNGGTAPIWASDDHTSYAFNFARNGTMKIYYATASAGTVTNGSGTAQLTLALPFSAQAPVSTNIPAGYGNYVASAAGTTSGILVGSISPISTGAKLFEPNATTSLKNNAFSASSDDLAISIIYQTDPINP